MILLRPDSANIIASAQNGPEGYASDVPHGVTSLLSPYS